jgi:hypothetical protein
MAMPNMNAEASLYRSSTVFHSEGNYGVGGGSGVSPQICVNSPCLRLPSGRFCVSLPVVGRRCVNIPSLGRWRIRCCTRFGIPPVSCRIVRC